MKIRVTAFTIATVFVQSVQAAPLDICLSKGEMRALVTLMVDRGSERIVDQCGAAMPEAAPFLAKNALAIKARFDGLRGASMATLLAKIFPFLPTQPTSFDTVVGALIDKIIDNAFDTDITAEACNQADILSESLAILPDENLISAMSVMMERVMRSHGDQLAFHLCPDEGQIE